MLHYATFDTALGPLLVASGRLGLVRVAYPDEPVDDVLAELEGLGVGLEQGPLSDERRQIDEYLDGRRQRFDISVDLSLVDSEFTKRILRATAAIPYGATATYGGVAAKAGHARGGRAAGNALHGNPVPLVIPCHRVVLASGKIGGYAGREDRKRWLLTLEGSL